MSERTGPVSYKRLFAAWFIIGVLVFIFQAWLTDRHGVPSWAGAFLIGGAIAAIAFTADRWPILRERKPSE